MPKPNYNDGSIVNLMSSVAANFGYDTGYGKVSCLNDRLGTKNLVLLVLDGVGYKYAMQYGKGTVFEKNMERSITSVYPSSTATALTSIFTASAPDQHGITGWFIYDRYSAHITAVVPYIARGCRHTLEDFMEFKDLVLADPILSKLKTKSYLVTKSDIIDSAFNKNLCGKAEVLGYNTLSGMFRQMKAAMKSSSKKKFILSYWPKFDKMSHDFGANHKDTISHFKEIAEGIERFVESCKEEDYKLIITADHGMLDTDISKQSCLDDHPELARNLILPFCSDTIRTVSCYVRHGRAKAFRDYVQVFLKGKCTMHTGEQIVKMGLFGNSNPGERSWIYDRVGDYVLLAKENYVFKDFLPGEDKKFRIGIHGGLTDEEMLVPLVLVEGNRTESRGGRKK